MTCHHAARKFSFFGTLASRAAWRRATFAVAGTFLRESVNVCSVRRFLNCVTGRRGAASGRDDAAQRGRTGLVVSSDKKISTSSVNGSEKSHAEDERENGA